MSFSREGNGEKDGIGIEKRKKLANKFLKKREKKNIEHNTEKRCKSEDKFIKMYGNVLECQLYYICHLKLEEEKY
jgi:hypothetical protein